MKVSHVLYKANNLEQAFQEFEKLGYKVEYGSKKKPQNALIYFSEGPYIELLEKAPISSFTKRILRLLGKGKLVDRFEFWENVKEGFFEICLENYTTDFKEEEQILRKFGQDYFITKSKRLDVSNRLLKWKLLFPNDLKIPFLMTYFNIDPKPKNFIHPNGIKKIKSISYGTASKFLPLLKELCEDDSLRLFVGEEGVKEIIYEK